MNTTRGESGNLIFGIFIIILGVLFLLDGYRILRFGDFVSTWWPLILIFIGTVKFARQERTGGIMLIGLGFAFLLANAGYFYWGDLFRLWPLILILFGFSIIFGGRMDSRFQSREVGEDEFSVRTILSGIEQKMSSQKLSGGEIMVLLGGAEVDLRQAVPAEGCNIRISVLFGGAGLKVPEDWQLIITGTPILGGISDTTRQNNTGPEVKINCSAIFGGIEIEN